MLMEHASFARAQVGQLIQRWLPGQRTLRLPYPDAPSVARLVILALHLLQTNARLACQVTTFILTVFCAFQAA